MTVWCGCYCHDDMDYVYMCVDCPCVEVDSKDVIKPESGR